MNMDYETLCKACTQAILAGCKVYLTHKKTFKIPKGFPRGELMCVNENLGHVNKLYDPIKVLTWVQKEIEKS